MSKAKINNSSNLPSPVINFQTKSKKCLKDTKPVSKRKQRIPNEKLTNEKKKSSKKRKNKSNSYPDPGIPIQNVDGDIDEILISAKKKKFNDRILNEDVEETLFLEPKKSKLNEILISAKLKKINDKILNEDVEETLFLEPKKSKLDLKKERLKKVLNINNNRNPVNGSATGNKLRQRMLERLKAAQFRFLNEKLYTSSGNEAKELFQSDPNAFEVYHQGYQQQLSKWPVKPLDVIVKKILKLPKSHKIADMGCGEALLSKRVPHTVRSFDLVATAPGVEVCDMARTPLLKESMDVLVYCLALMGTELTQYLVEANRVMKTGGLLLIAEVESRFDNVEDFTKNIQKLGFKLKQLDKSQEVFYFMEFVKIRDPLVKKSKLPNLYLKPCLYKRR